MKKIIMGLMVIWSVGLLAGCCNCASEPIVSENGALVTPPNFGKQPN